MSTKKDVKQVLVEARNLISKPECWAKKAFARDAYGDSVSVHSATAVAFCSIGAIEYAINRFSPSLFEAVRTSLHKELQKLVPAGTSESISYFNDESSTTHKMVLDLFDNAIKNLEKET